MCSSVTRVLDHPDRVSYRPPPLAAAKFLSPSIPYTSLKSALPVLDFRQSAQSRPICSGPGDVPYAGKPTFGTPLLLRSGRLTQSNQLEDWRLFLAPQRHFCHTRAKVQNYCGQRTVRDRWESLKRLELGDNPLAEYPNLLSQIG